MSCWTAGDGFGLPISDWPVCPKNKLSGEIAGTPAYMAPEQLSRGETSIQSDLYSLGLILYELFTGEAVYKPGSVTDLLREHEESSLPQPVDIGRRH